ncbi:MAG: nucleoside-diphosphate sugar epimerase/dehydratase [Maricaulaceae bacterium]
MSIFDSVLGFVAMCLAMTWRYDFENKPIPNGLEITAGLVYGVTVFVVWMGLRIHRGVWRFTSLSDIRVLLQGMFLVSIIMPLIMFLFFDRGNNFPRSVPIIAGAVFFGALTLVRVIVMFLYNGDIRAIFRRKNAKLPNALLLGSEKSAYNYIRDLSRKTVAPSFNIQGIVTTDANYKGRSIRGVPVLGDITEIETLVNHYNVKRSGLTLIATQPDLRREQSDKFVRVAARLSLPLVRVQSSDVFELTSFEAADLIGRPVQSHDISPVEKMLKGKTVLVTGGGGSIGSELVRQIFSLMPKKLLVLDVSEFNTYTILQELDPDGQLRQSGKLAAYLGDVRDELRVEDIFKSERPDIVLHAAALKHVPLGEDNPLQTLSTNLLGTNHVLKMALKYETESFTLISTDKAVKPTNIMGASKRLAELVTLCEQTHAENMSASCVRFGNVLASAGSVIPLFEKQIAKGGPVTVTHKDVERYFMTTEEAAALVLQSAALNLKRKSRTAAVYVLDMGEPVNIARLARQLIRLRGFVPERDIEIQFTGLRPGEKLSEVLMDDEEFLEATLVPGVRRFKGIIDDPRSTERRLNKIIKSLQARDRASVSKHIADVIPEYVPNHVLSND